MDLKKLKTKTGSKHEVILMKIIMFIGLVMMIAVLFKPLIAYFTLGEDNLITNRYDFYFFLVGFIFSVGNKSLGAIVNNLIILLKKRFGVESINNANK